MQDDVKAVERETRAMAEDRRYDIQPSVRYHLRRAADTLAALQERCERLEDRVSNLATGLEEIRDAAWTGADPVARIRRCAERWLSGREEALDALVRSQLTPEHSGGYSMAPEDTDPEKLT